VEKKKHSRNILGKEPVFRLELRKRHAIERGETRERRGRKERACVEREKEFTTRGGGPK